MQRPGAVFWRILSYVLERKQLLRSPFGLFWANLTTWKQQTNFDVLKWFSYSMVDSKRGSLVVTQIQNEMCYEYFFPWTQEIKH